MDPLLYDFLTTYVGRRRAAPDSVTAADLEPSRPLRPHPDGSGPPAEGRRVPGASSARSYERACFVREGPVDE